MTPLVHAVRAAVGRHRLLSPGDRVLIAVSGGPDSVALLHALVALREALDLSLVVGHVHHGLRPEGDQDLELVRGLAARLDCPVVVERVHVPDRPGRSPETAARSARYAALGRLARRVGAARVAVAHTADDQAETVLMRLLQGAGPRGLAGIPVRRGAVVRPLLEVGRAAVLAHLAAHGLPYSEDATNRDVKRLRNRIRHELMPLLAAHGVPRLAEALCRSAAASRELTEALDALLLPGTASLVRPALGGVRLDLAPFAGLPPGAVKALFRLALVEVAAQPEVRPGLRAGHLEQLAGLVGAPPGARVRLPGGLVVERGRDAVWVVGRTPWGEPLPLAVPGETVLTGLGGRLVATSAARPATWPDEAAEVWLDPEGAPAPLRVRPRRPGDRFVPFGQTGPVRVARALAAAGLPRAVRAHWPLLVAGGGEDEHVLWVIGVRRATAAPLTRHTTAPLRIRLVLDPVGGAREDST